MIRFTNKFPFIGFKKKISLTKHTVDDIPDNIKQNLIATSKEQLIENRIPLRKIRFVFEKSFMYDVDNNIINPPYKIINPTKKKHSVIEIGKPKNIMTVFLGENRTYDNFTFLKQMMRKSKRGVALLVGDDYDEVMWLSNLDNATEFYNESVNITIDYES